MNLITECLQLENLFLFTKVLDLNLKMVMIWIYLIISITLDDTWCNVIPYSSSGAEIPLNMGVMRKHLEHCTVVSLERTIHCTLKLILLLRSRPSFRWL